MRLLTAILIVFALLAVAVHASDEKLAPTPSNGRPSDTTPMTLPPANNDVEATSTAEAGSDRNGELKAVIGTSVPQGVYQPFSAWQKVQLGATALVNPKAAKNAAVVNFYEPQAISASGHDLESFLKSHRVTVAEKVAQDSWEVLSPREAEIYFNMLRGGESVKGVGFMTFHALPNVKGESLITWGDAKQAPPTR